MSAIAGIWRRDGGSPGHACERMLAALSIYGPDDSASWADDEAALGRRLYERLPEDRFDRQPVVSRDGRMRLVADLRLDNRDELSVDLGLPAGEAASLSDSALLMRALEAWGDAAVQRLDGEWAYVVWRADERRLTLVRDAIGARPLAYHEGEGFFAFASMAKGLHALPDVPYGVNEQWMALYVALMPQAGPETPFKGVSRVEPGCMLTVTPGGLRSERWWNPSGPTDRLSMESYVEGLRHHLDRAVRACVRGAEDRVASHLSSGWDSSTVTASAARQMAGTGGKVIAFTHVPRDRTVKATRGRFADEGPLAALTAAMYPNVEHVLVPNDARSPMDGLDREFFTGEQPVLNPCNMAWVRAIDDEAKQRGLKVLLSGSMGNMTISYYGLEVFAEALGRGDLLKFLRLWATLSGNGSARPLEPFRHGVGPYMPVWMWEAFLRLRKMTPYKLRDYSALAERWETPVKAAAAARGLDLDYRPRRDGFESRMWVLNRMDGGAIGKGTLASHGVEWRDPTANRRLIEFCLSIPTEMWFAGGRKRGLARMAWTGRLPPEVLNEGRKALQASDWYEGFTAGRGDMAAEVERLEQCAPAADILDTAVLRQRLEDWPEGGWDGEEVMMRYRLALGRGVAAGHFIRKASGSNY